jgi:hypothetical protein
VNQFQQITGNYGFVYDGSTFTTIDNPLGGGGTYVTGIDGNNIVGYYTSVNQFQQITGNYGFVYDGSTFTTIDNPLGGGGTYVTGIDGNNIIGYYTSVNQFQQITGNHGFMASLASLPEPSTYALFALGVIGMLMALRRKKESGQAF